MDINKILNSDYIDIIFDGRNKLYGSYELRKQYPVRAKRAAGIVLAIMFLLLVIPLIIRLISGVVDNLEAPKTSKRELVMKEPPPLDPKKPEPPPPPKMPPAPPRPTVRFTPPEVVKDEEVQDPPPTKEELKTAAAGPETKNEGPGDVNAITPPGDGNEGPSNGVVSDAPPAPVTWVEQMPEFPGGERAMSDFIQKHFRVTDAARESGQDMARVTVRFIVDSEGSISDVKLVRGVGYGLDEEALRIVRSFPKWKAGKQNGKAVPVIFTLPITVSIE